MEWRIVGLMQAFVAQHVHLFVLDLRGKLIFCLFYFLSYHSDLLGSHRVPGHAARRTVDVIEHSLALDMNQMPAA